MEGDIVVKRRSHIYTAPKNEDTLISPTLQQSYLLHQNGACGTSPTRKMVPTAYLLHQNDAYSISLTHKMEYLAYLLCQNSVYGIFPTHKMYLLVAVSLQFGAVCVYLGYLYRYIYVCVCGLIT